MTCLLPSWSLRIRQCYDMNIKDCIIEVTNQKGLNLRRHEHDERIVNSIVKYLRPQKV